jgi:hypothetical protein
VTVSHFVILAKITSVQPCSACSRICGLSLAWKGNKKARWRDLPIKRAITAVCSEFLTARESLAYLWLGARRKDNPRFAALHLDCARVAFEEQLLFPFSEPAQHIF